MIWESSKASGGTDFSVALRRFASTARNKGVAIVLSDFFDPKWQEGLKALLKREDFRLPCCTCSLEDEIHPNAVRRSSRIIDSETDNESERDECQSTASHPLPADI